MKNKFYYFKIVFLPILIAFFAGSIIYGFLEFKFEYSIEAVVKLIVKSLAVGFLTGLVLGILNVFFKAVPFHHKQ